MKLRPDQIREASCWATLAASSALALYLMRSFFGPGLPVAWDGQAHLVRLLNMLRFLSHGSLWGWSFDWYNGFEPFLFYPPLFFLSAAFVTLFGISPLVALKVTAIAGWILLPEAVYFAARLLRLNRVEALAAGMLSVGISTIGGAGIEGLFTTGLYVQVFALPLTMLALACLIRAAEEGGKWVGWTALGVGLVMLVHVISTAFLCLATIVLLLVELYQRRALFLRSLWRVGLGWCLAGGIAVVVWLPMIIHWSLAGAGTGWGTRADFTGMIFGQLVGGPVVSICALLFVTAVKKKTLADRAIALLFVLGILLGGGYLRSGINSFDMRLEQVFKERALPYAGVLACLCTARFIGASAERLHYRLSTRGAPVMMFVFWAGAASILGYGFAYTLHRRIPQTVVDSQDKRAAKHLNDEALRWLRLGSAPRSLVAVDFRGLNPAEPGHARLQARVVLLAERPALPGSQIESTRSPSSSFLSRLHDLDAGEIEKRLIMHGVSYVMTSSADSAQNLRRIGRVQEVYANPTVTIFKVNGVDPALIQINPVEVTSFHFTEEKLEWKLRRAAPGPAPFAISYHPYWRATVNGMPAPVQPAAGSLIEINLPAGEVELVLEFKHPLWRRLAPLISALSALLCVGLVIFLKSSKRRARGGLGDAEKIMCRPLSSAEKALR